VKLLVVILTILTLTMPLWDAMPAQAQYPEPNACIGIASDSNGYGHVTVQIPTDNEVGIVYIQPLAAVLAEQLEEADLAFEIKDRSMSAAGLTTSGRTDYLASIPYGNLINDFCKYVIVTPFYTDISAGQATPSNYLVALQRLVYGLLKNNPNITIFVLDYYEPNPAEFTRGSSTRYLFPDRLAEFNAKIALECEAQRMIGRYPQVVCINTQALFEDVPNYLFENVTEADYREAFHTETGITPLIDAFFAANPDGVLIGDGFHLGMAGRVAIMQHLVEQIAEREAE
jgi:lysophospholipase L1-like esterase